mgnify:CR=1 FL=1
MTYSINKPFVTITFETNGYATVEAVTVNKNNAIELVSPETRVIIPYKKADLYLIGMRNMRTLDELNIEDNLILKIVSSTTRKKYNNIIFNRPIRGLKTINEYKYQLILKKLKYWALKLQKKED